MSTPLRLGTRKSALAMAQSGQVASALMARHPGLVVDLVPIVTTGDVAPDAPFDSVGTVGMFVTEIERALLENRIDMAVHSLKDLPTAMTAGLKIAAVPPRANPFDVLIWRDAAAPRAERPRFGTGSPRRAAQILAARPDARVMPIRGNVDTRLSKLGAGEFDAIVLAAAGLDRLGLLPTLDADGRLEPLDMSRMVPAPGQGCLGLQCRADDAATGDLLRALDDFESQVAARAERALLAALGGGCHAPIAAFAHLSDGVPRRLRLLGLVIAPDGRTICRQSLDGDPADPEGLGLAAARALFADGAGAILGRAGVVEP